MKRFKYQPLGKELKLQTDFAKKKQTNQKTKKRKQYHKLDNTYEYAKKSKKEKPTFKKYDRSNLIYNIKCSFYEYYNIKNVNSLSLTSKDPSLLSFYGNLNKFNNLNPQKKKKKKKKKKKRKEKKKKKRIQ